MFFIVSKITGCMLSPLNWIVLLFIAFAILKNKKAKRYILIINAVLLLVFTNNAIIDKVIEKSEYPANHSIFEDPITYKYGIVPGGFSGYNKKYKMVEFNGASDRLLYALQLYHTQKVDKLILTGGSGRLLEQELKETDKLYPFVLKMGIDSMDIIIESNSRNTYENAVNTKKVMGNDSSTCVLITSASHMKRAMGCFQHQKINVIPFAVDFMSEYDEQHKFRDVISFSFGNFDAWKFLFKEKLGYRIYKMKGYL